ncbi:tripartite tricarboxylate transporter substrate binding protein [Achromobacter sp. LC458]|uniref:Bug family tripartite tricarboxylate transporter substrate binding protein n=1 Tax=Achromobacter sp. LC458 TaxID=1120623 RepID=UPI000629F050|nr:tripartite tricarboxylate transporter substrate binding protein [Achromobacter sp. LC458]TRM52835.1 tripartite tricarboxylate transporter substrate binding protein [Achromobacter sp. LC458]
MQKRIVLRGLVALCVGLAGAGVQGLAQAQAQNSYPSHQVRFVIPFPPGGTLDMLGRDLAQKLSEQTGQTFIVENRSGGNGIIGADVVAKSPADGYTLLFNASTFTTAPMTMKSVPYDVDKNFVPVALAGKAPLSLSVKKDLPVTDLAGLLAYAKQNPGRLTFAVGSIGSAGHLATELLKRQGGLDYTVIPYRGTSPALQDLVGGRIDGFIDPVLGAVSYYKSGMLKILAVTSEARLPNLPDVPTVSEILPGYQFYSWYGLWAPAGTPAPVVEKLNAEVNKALSSGMTAKYEQLGVTLTPGSAGAFAQFQKDDMARSLKIVQEGRIHVE